MSTRSIVNAGAAIALLTGTGALSREVPLGDGSIVALVASLQPGEFVWAPKLAPEGPTLLVVNLTNQRAVLYRNGVPIGATTVSTGKEGYETPTGAFTILQKKVEHYSSTYNNAPMPYMQRLTWKGVALHAGKLPGYPASHGCIRLPIEFSKLLYGQTNLGMTVVITDKASSPRVAPSPDLVVAGPGPWNPKPTAGIVWKPEASPSGPVSIIVSVADGRASVLRNGVEIGSAPVSVEGPVTGTWAYALESVDAAGKHWIKLPLSSTGKAGVAATDEFHKFDAPPEFRREVARILQPGATVIVTSDSLRAGSSGSGVTVIEGDPTST